jgi:hypothetical protein
MNWLNGTEYLINDHGYVPLIVVTIFEHKVQSPKGLSSKGAILMLRATDVLTSVNNINLQRENL